MTSMNGASHSMAIGCFIALLISCTPKPDQPLATEIKPPEKQAEAAPLTKGPTELPAITLIRENGETFSATALEGNSILIFFSSDCDHCQREATEIQKHLIAFKDYSLLFVSMNPFSEMRKFSVTYKIDHEPNVQFLRADGKTVFDSFGSIQTPTICVYDKSKKLVRKFDGETNINDIIKVL